ncbi:MAG: hypothetical protein AB1762_16805 [Gemmatimonadota bacterium]
MPLFSPTVTKAFWIAVLALVIGVWGIWKRYQYNDWYFDVQTWAAHVNRCHLESTTTHSSAAELAACPGGNHVSPPPPPPPWF